MVDYTGRYDKLTWFIDPSRSGKSVLLTLRMDYSDGSMSSEARTYRIPTKSGRKFIEDFVNAYKDAQDIRDELDDDDKPNV